MSTQAIRRAAGPALAALGTALAVGCAARARHATPATFTNPIVRSRAAGDPWVIRSGDSYFFTATLAPDSGLSVWKSRTLTGLDSGTKVRVWSAPPEGPLSRQIWAPELHRLRGRWYLYFTASDGVDSNHRLYVLAAKSDDPQGAYEAPVRVDPSLERYAIDGSVLELPDGRLFFMYCANGVFIAPMSDPMHVSGPGVQVIRGSEEWEHEWRYENGAWKQGAGYWVEAPEALVHDGRVFIVYSAGHTATPHYYLGLLTLTGTDPLDSAAWSKRRDPIFAPYQGADGNVFTPGHNSFTTSPDGREDWIVYHARDIPFENGTRAGFRTVRAQRFTWDADGSPRLGHPVPSGVPMQRPSDENQ